MSDQKVLEEAQKKIELVKEELCIFIEKSRLGCKVGVKELLRVVKIVDEVLLCFNILDIAPGRVTGGNAESVGVSGVSEVRRIMEDRQRQQEALEKANMEKLKDTIVVDTK